MTPRPARIMCGTTARVQTKTPLRLTLTTAANAASSIVETTAPSFPLTSCASRTMPALVTRTSMRPCSLTTSSTARSTDSRLVTSIFGSVVTSHTTTRAPSAANRSAVARPMPAAPPVTMTTRSLRFRSKLEHPPQPQLKLAVLPRRAVRAERRFRPGRRGLGLVGGGAIRRQRRAAQELAGGDAVHIPVGVVEEGEELGDSLEAFAARRRGRPPPAQRELAEQRPVLGVARVRDAARADVVEEAVGRQPARAAVGVLAVAVEVVTEAVRPRLTGAVLVDRRDGHLPRRVEDAGEDDAIALRAARAAVLGFEVRRIVRIAEGELGAEVVADVLFVRERDRRGDEVALAHVAVEREDERAIRRVAVVRVDVDLVVRGVRADGRRRRRDGVAGEVHVADGDLVASFDVDRFRVEVHARLAEPQRVSERRLVGLGVLVVRIEQDDGRLRDDAGRGRVVRIERQRRDAEQRAVDARERHATGEAVLLPLLQRRHEEEASDEAPRAAAHDAAAVAGEVVGEGGARLVIVRVALAAVVERRLQCRVVAVRVEVVAQAEVDEEVRVRPPGIFDEGAVEVRRHRHVRRADAVRVREREAAVVGEIEEEAGRVGVDARALLDALRGEAGLEVVRGAAGGEVLVEGVAELEGIAGAEEVAEDVAAGHQRVAGGKPLRDRCRVRRLVVAVIAVLRARLVVHVGGEDGVVLERGAPVAALQRLAVALVREGRAGVRTDAEVVLLVGLVDDLFARGLLRAELLIEAAEEERLIERVVDVGGERGELAEGTEERRPGFVDLLDRGEVERAVARQRAADRAADLVARVVAFFLRSDRLRAEIVVAEEAEDVAVEIVRAALGDDGHGAAGGAADLGGEAVLDDAELADGILAEARAGLAEGGVGDVDAVDEDRGLRGVAARADDRAVVDEAEAAALALHARREEGELLEVAVRDRELLDLLGQDIGRGVGLVDVDDLGRGVDGDDVAGLRLHGDGDLRVLAEDEGTLGLLDGGEAFERELDVVDARREGEEARGAAGVGDADGGEAGLGPGDGDGDAGQRRLGLIEGDGLDGGFVHLREGGNGEEEKNERGEEQRAHRHRAASKLKSYRTVGRFCVGAM